MLRIKENETDRAVIEEVENKVVDSFTIEELERRIEKEDALVAQHTKQAEKLRNKLRDALNLTGVKELLKDKVEIVGV